MQPLPAALSPTQRVLCGLPLSPEPGSARFSPAQPLDGAAQQGMNGRGALTCLAPFRGSFWRQAARFFFKKNYFLAVKGRRKK